MAAQLPAIATVDPVTLRGARALVRASLNVPLADGVVRDDFRLQRAEKTISFLREQGARVIVVGHIGRESDATLRPVYDALSTQMSLQWCDTVIGEEATAAVAALAEGEVLLLENLRTQAGETENDPAFAKTLAAYADIYVNDAFSVSHREHASIVGVPAHIPGYAGFLFMEEYETLRAMRAPDSPSLFVLGGAKFATKEPLIRAFLDVYDAVCVGGALANECFKAKGYEVGTSVIEDGVVAPEVLEHPHLRLPEQVTVVDDAGTVTKKAPQDVAANEKIVDAFVPEELLNAKTILWNGPLGYYEGGYDEGTHTFAKAIAASPAQSVVGGGDTVAAIESLGVTDDIGFVSTAGGAMLAFLERGTLPGIDALTAAT